MHILEIPSFLPPLGGEFCLQQARALSDRGHQVRILSCNLLGISGGVRNFLSTRWTGWTEEMNGITAFRTNLHGIPRSIRLNQRRYCQVVWHLYLHYRQQFGKPDLLHAHCCLWGGMAARFIAEKEHLPFFITEHLSRQIFENVFGSGWQHDRWAKSLLRETYDRANCVIPVSQELVDDLAPYFGTSYTVHPISNMIDISFFTFRKRESTNDRPFRYCCIAISDIYRKGLDVLAKAYEGMDNTELFLAGQGTDSDALAQLFSRCKHVHFLGKVSRNQVRDLLYQCDALVLPSRSEAQGLVILEALCTGIPVVTTDAIPQNALHPQATLVAKAGDADSLALRLQQVKEIRFHEEWSREVSERVSPSVIAHQIEAVFTANCKD